MRKPRTGAQHTCAIIKSITICFFGCFWFFFWNFINWKKNCEKNNKHQTSFRTQQFRLSSMFLIFFFGWYRGHNLVSFAGCRCLDYRELFNCADKERKKLIECSEFKSKWKRSMHLIKNVETRCLSLNFILTRWNCNRERKKRVSSLH